MTTETTYNGWANYETWNVALWIGNDEGLYSLARAHKNRSCPYNAFIEDMESFAGDENEANAIFYRTPDGVAWNDSGLDHEALDKMIAEL